MPDSQFLDAFCALLVCCKAGNELRIAAPQPRYAHHADMVVTGEGLSAAVAEQMAKDPTIAAAEYVASARSINVMLEDAAIVSALESCNDETPTSFCISAPDTSEPQWEAPFYAVQYALCRAKNIATDETQWQCAPAAARKLAVALLLLPREMKRCATAWEFMTLLTALTDSYDAWHESLLVSRAQKKHRTSTAKTNGDLMQKEAIQYPISSALLARAAALTLHNGLLLLRMEPTKDWVA